MGIISPFTTIRALSVCHLFAAYLLLTSPRSLTDQNVVVVLGESVRLPHITTMDTPSEATAFAGLILALLGASDLAAAGLEESVSLQYWLSAAPVRLVFLFVITGYAYLFKDDGLFGAGSAAVYGKAGVGELLRNSLVFSFGFLELVAWFWVSALETTSATGCADAIGM